MLIIKTRLYNLPTYECLKEFEDSFPDNLTSKFHIKSKVVKKIVQETLKYYPAFFSNMRPGNKYNHVISILMAAHDVYRLIPYSFMSANKHVYLYDLWENEYSYFIDIVKALRLNTVFLSSKATADYLKENYSGLSRFIWLPEAVKAENYTFLPYHEKNIDILSFKRRNELYHLRVLEYCKKNSGVYHYQQSDKLLFADQKEFVNGLARTKISVCFPASDTHPSKAGSISKITMRYFQSMASKCLILGKAPDDMKYIFDYNPVIEVDNDDPEGQLEEILKKYENYIPLIEKNYQEVLKNHQYKNRAGFMLKVISASNN